AGRNGNFALVLGVARNGDTQTLKAFGADIAVNDLSEFSYQDMEKWFESGIKNDAWQLNYYGYDPVKEKLRETLTTVGNGYFGTRGCMVSCSAEDDIHYPGTYIAGLYNKLPTEVHGRTIYNNDFVNCPNWLLIELKIGDGEFINPVKTEVLEYNLRLDVKNAVTQRSITFKDDQGRITTLETVRFASMDDPHIGTIKYELVPQNYSDKITLRSVLDGTVINNGVPRYRSLNSKHLDCVATEARADEIQLQVKTNCSKVDIAMLAVNTLYTSDKSGIHSLASDQIERDVEQNPGQIAENLTISVKEGLSYVLEKLVSIYTSKDEGVSDPVESCQGSLVKSCCFDDLLTKHIAAWQKLWDTADFIIEGDRFSQKAIRLHVYHLLVSASPHNTNIDAGMTARGLHGEAYRGHIFWDELFIFPFYNLHFPDITKSLLMYRYRRLDAARDYARENGYEGAMYPWQGADGGEEETQELHYNPVSKKWDPDLSRRQRHVSIAIAYNIWLYFYCTNDLEFLYDYGAEIMLEIARFWASLAKYDEADGRYHIAGVMGPDEFHEKYHDATEDGLKDNAYTNVMVAWLIHKTVESVERLPEEVLKKISDKIGFKYEEVEKWKNIFSNSTVDRLPADTQEKFTKVVGIKCQEIEAWKDIVSKLKVVIDENGIISQFDGFMDLNEINREHYRKKYGDIHRMDRILKAEGDSPDKYQIAKQADVLMLYYILAPGQVQHILNIMDYEVDDAHKFMRKNYEYYEKRTSHGSTLSLIVHSAILRYLHTHKKNMWNWFLSALGSDLNDIQGGTTSECIHTGVMGGTIDIVMKSFAGLHIFKNYIKLEPNFPEHWHSLTFKIVFKNNLVRFNLTKNNINVKLLKAADKEFLIQVADISYTLDEEGELNISY
ncbi:glycoside hydrolase family 65 protein, partial [Candidatus Margulisiibacteriota bacterium]